MNDSPGGWRGRPLVDTRWLEEDMEDLYENAPCGYVSTLPDGTIVKVNETFLRWTGYDRPALHGVRRFNDLLTIGGRIFFETHFVPLLRMQRFAREIAFDILCADGRRLPVLVNATERADDAGRATVVRITVFDATERRRYERELLMARARAEQAAEARTNLVATLSHDIRTPLSAILMASAMLEKSEPTPRQQRFIEVLRSSCNQALALVNNLLDLSRLEAGQAALRERAFDFRRMVEDVIAGVRLIADQKPGLSLNVTLDEQIPDELIADADKLAQVLANLVSNAVKFTERGFVSLIVGVRDLDAATATLEVLVSDTGIGIPADRLPHIFEEYTQASGEIASRYGGTGLGLAISRRLLLLYRSELRVTSTVGQGTTFSFTLRLRRSDVLDAEA